MMQHAAESSSSGSRHPFPPQSTNDSKGATDGNGDGGGDNSDDSDDDDALFSDDSDDDDEERPPPQSSGAAARPAAAAAESCSDAVDSKPQSPPRSPLPPTAAQQKFHPNDPRSRAAAAADASEPADANTAGESTERRGEAADKEETAADEATAQPSSTGEGARDEPKTEPDADDGAGAGDVGDTASDRKMEDDGGDDDAAEGPPPPRTAAAAAASKPDGGPVDPSSLTEYPPAEDVVHIDEVEWATPEELEKKGGKRYTEKATRPKFSSADEPCGCFPDQSRHMCCVDDTCVLFACQEECRSNCDAARYCGNKRIQRKEWKKLQVFDAGNKGRGLRALEPIKGGAFCTEYVGVAIKKKCLEDVFRRYKQERMLYIMALDNSIYLDARKRGGIARYINHSCDPNCKVDRWKVRGVLRACVFALRDIAVGEELSFDYQWSRQRGRAPTKCYCGGFNCRGTLELPKESDLEEEEMETKLLGHWSKGPGSAARSIINRTIKIWYEGNQEHYVADVYDYDENTGKHLVIYKSDLSESWEDLTKESWMLLDEEGEKFVIAKKKRGEPRAQTAGSGSLSPMPGSPSPAHIGIGMEPGPGVGVGVGVGGDDGSAGQGQGHPPGEKFKNYVIVQTPMKEELQRRHVVHRCQNRMRVQISVVRVVPRQYPTGPNAAAGAGASLEDEAEAEEAKALKESRDGNAWKLVVSGYDPVAAMGFLRKNIDNTEARWAAAEEAAASAVGGAADSTTSSMQQKEEDGETDKPTAFKQELVIPRSIDQAFKNRTPAIRSQCRGSVDVSFVHSDSKSKQFARVVLEASLPSDLERAREVVWKEVDTLCRAGRAPRTKGGEWKDFGFLGGELSSEEFGLVFHGGGMGSGGETVGDEEGSASGTLSPPRGSQLAAAASQQGQVDCTENLRHTSPFCSSFEDLQRCAVWVQSSADMGRIDSHNRRVGESRPSLPRKIYFGSEPRHVPRLWGLIRSRANDVVRGVRFVNLGADRVFQPALVAKRVRRGPGDCSDFFDYVQRSTGAKVTIDNLAKNHLRVEAIKAEEGGANDDGAEGDAAEKGDDPSHRIALAEELIRLQVEVLRDHSTRKHRWGFGREWTLLSQDDSESSPDNSADNAASAMPTGGTAGVGSGASRNQNLNDPRAVASTVIEISEINGALDLDESVAAHACIILYRFLNRLAAKSQQSTSSSSSSSHLKLREISLACLFLAEKSQKVKRWKRLEDVLDAAYGIYYPGGTLSGKREEAANWERRVFAAEGEILTALDHDVFWPGVEWIISAVSESGRVAEPIARNAMELALSGPVLAAGPSLWLRLGPEYAFAAVAGFLSIDVGNIFASIPGLVPIKVGQAAEIIAKSVRSNTSKKKAASRGNGKGGGHGNDLFNGGQLSLLNTVPLVQKACQAWMASRGGNGSAEHHHLAHHGGGGHHHGTGTEWTRHYDAIARRARHRRIIPGIESDAFTERVLPAVDGIREESGCAISFRTAAGPPDAPPGAESVVLEGEWRACALAEHLLRAAVKREQPTVVVPRGEESSPEERADAASLGGRATEEPQLADGTAMVSPSSQGSAPPSGGAPPSSYDLPASMDVDSTEAGASAAAADARSNPQGSPQAKLSPGVLPAATVDTSEGCWDEASSDAAGSGDRRNRSVRPGRGGGAAAAPRVVGADPSSRRSPSAPQPGHRLVGGKTAHAGTVPENALRAAGLRWWIPPRYGPGTNGSLCDALFVRRSLASGGDDGASGREHFVALARLAGALVGDDDGGDDGALGRGGGGKGAARFPVLRSYLNSDDGAADPARDKDDRAEERRVPVSLQRWPPERVDSRERDSNARGKSADGDSSDDGGGRGGSGGGAGGGGPYSMAMGFSAQALQEMQLLYQLHYSVPAPEGHPNFVMPFALVVSDEEKTPADEKEQSPKSAKTTNANSSFEASRDLLALVQQHDLTSLREDEAQKKKERTLTGAHLVFQPTPLVLDRIISRTKKRSPDESRRDLSYIPGPVLAGWCHDLLSALAHCHANHVVLRSVRPDQILIDRGGVAKFSGFYRAIVMRLSDRGRYLDPLRSAQQYGRKRGRDKDDDLPTNPHMAPELLLGATRETKETDIFALGSLLAQLLLNKPLFSGKSRSQRIEAVFKIVGSPSESLGLYPEGAQFPYYQRPRKNYKHGVEKALRFMLKGKRGVENVEEYAGIITVIDGMLRLDPKERVTAYEALEHEAMREHLRRGESEAFRKEYVEGWVGLRDDIIEVEQAAAEPPQDQGLVELPRRQVVPEGVGAEPSERSLREQKERKRKKMLLEASRGASGDDDDDDLYNLDDVLAPSMKKARVGGS